jgi:hypothetical protein
MATTTVGCLSQTPSADSASCLEDDDCTVCGRCDKGTCVFDDAAAARPFCVDESEDPCDGVDTDGNGVIDDPEVCWAPVYAWTGGGGGRCFGASASEPPAPCAGYLREGAAPAFALAARLVRGTVPVRQCSLGSEHVLIADVPLFGPTTDTNPRLASDAWRALGYACDPVLGQAFTAAPEVGAAVTPYGPVCALSRMMSTAGGGGRWTAWLGGDPAPDGWLCEPDSTWWVGSAAATCAATAPARCDVPICEPTPAGRLIASTPANDATLAPGFHPLVLHLLNDGPVTWPAGWCFVHTAGVYTAGSSAHLTRDVPVGAGYDLELSLDVPAAGIDLRETWELRDAPCTSVGEPVFAFSYTFDVAAPFAARVVDRSPANESAVAVSNVPLTYSVTLENSGVRPWPPGLRVTLRDGGDLAATLLDLAVGERASVSLTGSVPSAPDAYVDRWQILDADDNVVPVDGAAGFDTVVWAKRPTARAVVTARTVPSGAAIRPGQRFTQVFLLENLDGGAWEPGMTLRHASGDLGRVATVTRVDAVGVGWSWVAAVPMQVPGDATGPLRDGWTLYDRDSRVVGVEQRDPDATTRYGSQDGAWLWTEVVPVPPCAPAAIEEEDTP